MQVRLLVVSVCNVCTLVALSSSAFAQRLPIEAPRPTGNSTGSGTAAEQVDFQAQIWPILKEHCLDCHNEKAEGGLRLDQKKFAERGGHSTSPILGPSVESSELLKRISSSDETYRMPRDRSPLPPEQITLLRRWIEQGSPWPDDSDAQKSNIRTIQPPTDARPMFRDDGPDLREIISIVSQDFGTFEGLRQLALFLSLFTLLIIGVERAKKRANAATQQATAGKRRLLGLVRNVGIPHYIILLMIVVFVRGYFVVQDYYREQLRIWVNYSNDLVRKWPTGIPLPQRANTVVIDAIFGNPPVPFRPQHPKRLSGSYYRGNCERNEKLFNGGNYRTATLNLSLCGRDEKPLNFNDPVPEGGLFIRLEIVRAAKATDSLFSDNVISNILLSPLPNGLEVNESDAVKFSPIEPKERWAALYPLGMPDPEQQTMSGLVYVYYNKFPHYGIQYDLDFSENRITENSDLWLGVLFISPQVMRPVRMGQIPFQQWFSEDPIPEITGENTTDPKLLGVEEHFPSGKKDGDKSENPPAREPLIAPKPMNE